MTDLEKKAELLAEKIRHYLVGTLGRMVKEVNDREFFQGLSYALREEVMVNWIATQRTFLEKGCRFVYYLSMEYLPGRQLINNISNLHAHEVVKQAVQKLGKDYRRIVTVEPDPGLGNGGLGRLASCLLDSLATQQYPAMGYGLRYQYGIFEQQLWEGEQIEKPDCWLLNENPWECRHDDAAKIVKFSGIMKKRKNSHQEEILDIYEYEEVRALPYDVPIIGYREGEDFNVNTLRLWSTKESPHNFHLQRYNAGLLGQAAENTLLTDVLYPNDNHDMGKRIRLKQEFLLVSASLQDIIARHLSRFKTLSNFADKVRIQINDTHPALIIAELVRVLTKDYKYSWKEAWEITQQVVSYTNHTILTEALEQWNQERFSALLPRQYWIIEKLNHEFCEGVRMKYPNDEERVRRLSLIENGQIRMAHLAILGSHKVNGVAKMHGAILQKETFKDFYALFPFKFTYVTNGVTQRHWLKQCNPLLADWITQKIGKEWLLDFSKIAKLKEIASDPQIQQEFLEIKRQCKQKLLTFIQCENPLRDAHGYPQQCYSNLSVDSLFDVQVKRIHEYKRQFMNVLHLIMVYQELLEDPQCRKIKRTVIFGGKAAAGYETAKATIYLIDSLSRVINEDPRIQGKLKVIFVENYCVEKAELIMPAAELSEQISTAGMEASGTGNMKLAINGALTIGTEDGANIEMREAIGDQWWPFSFGAKAEQLDHFRLHKTYNPWDIYTTHPKVKGALDVLKNGTFARSEKDKTLLSSLFDSLMLGYYGMTADRYFILHDLLDYYETQKKVEALYSRPLDWAKYALHNIGGMGKFSSDRAIETYANAIWEIKKCPVQQGILKAVRQEFSQ